MLKSRRIDLLKAMHTFVKVADRQSFSQAAQVLNLAPSAVSKQVADLEAHFSVPLLYRTTRAMHLTGEGEYFLEQFRDILARISLLEDIASQQQAQLSGSLCISAPQGSASLGYLQKASEFIKLHPGVRISWLFLNRFVNMVEEGVDLSIRIGHLADSTLIARRYAWIQVCFVASPSYLAIHGTPAHPQELNRHQCILDSSNRQPGRWQYQQQGDQKSVAVSPFVQANDGETCARLAADGQGIAYLPSFVTKDLLASGQLVHLMTEFQLPQLPVSLVFPSNRLTNPTLRALVDFMLKQDATDDL